MASNSASKPGNSLRVVIIGGGISGLATAHQLVEHCKESRQHVEILLLEADSKLGGTVQTESREGFLLERGPDSFISEKPQAINLAKRIGLESQLIETNKKHRRSFIVRRGRLRPVPEGFQLLAPSRMWPFVTSDIFSWTGKARMAMDLLLPRGGTNGSADESLASFVRRRLGSQALDRMAQPMIGGIYTADAEKLSLRATLPRFLEMERTDRSVILGMWKRARKQKAEEIRGTSGARYSLFLSFERGMQTLVDGVAAKLPPGTVQLNTRVEKLLCNRSSGQWTIKLDSRDPIVADAVCVALPAYAAARLLRETDAKLAADLEVIAYESTATVNLGYKREDVSHPLDGFGCVVPFIERRAIIACTFSSVKFPNRAPEGCVLLRAFVGGALQPDVFALDEAQMIDRVQTDLRDLLGIKKPPLFTAVTKWQRSMPQYHLGHLNRIKQIGERLTTLPGLKLAGNAYAGPGLPDCIRSGESAADEILSSFTIQEIIRAT